jgi:replicative DNA helicase
MANQPVFRSLDGPLPQNLEAEQAVLGSLLIDPRAVERVAAFLQPGDFFLPVNAELYRGMLALYELDRPTDIVTLSDYLGSQNRMDDTGGPAYLASLAGIVPTAVNVEYYARIVERLSVLRRLVEAGTRITGIGYEERLEAEDAIEQAERVLYEVSRARITRDFVPISTVLNLVYEKLDQIHSHETEVTGIPTGFIDLDRLTSGLQRSDLIILAARPSMGKTSLALNVAHSIAVKGKLPVGIFSIEMAAEQLAQRLISLQSNVESQRLRSGRMSDADWDNLIQGIGVLSEAPIYVDDSPGLTLAEMRSKARRLHSEQGLGLLIVDYLQLMTGSSSENRVQEISAISRGLKGIARELNVPVMAVAQLSRAPDQRPDHTPILSDLRESGSIEQDADIVMFIYRDVKYNSETERPHVADIIVAKHRNGPTGSVHLFYQEALMKFLDLSVHGDF